MQQSPESGSDSAQEGSLGDDVAPKGRGAILTCDARVSVLTWSDTLLRLPGCGWLRPLADALSFLSGLLDGALDANPQPVSHLLALASLASLDLISFPCDLQEPLGVLWTDLPILALRVCSTSL